MPSLSTTLTYLFPNAVVGAQCAALCFSARYSRERFFSLLTFGGFAQQACLS
jgi:hypothetical protein